MKKTLAAILIVGMAFILPLSALADGTTTLTTTVPDATYTLNIPADQEIPFGATRTNIGNVTVTDSTGFAEGKNLEVTADFDEIKCENTSTTIPYKIRLSLIGIENPDSSDEYLESGDFLTFPGTAQGTVEENATILPQGVFGVSGLNIEINSTDWGQALAGEYATTITFTSEVVAG